MTKYNIKQVEVARETGIHHSSLSLWLQGKIKGHMVKISETIENYLENFMSNKPRMNTMHISKLNLLKSPNNRIDEELDNNNGFGTLIPIKIDLEIEGKRLKENFLWDKNEPYLTLESFAKILMEEHNLPATFENEIVNTMKKQVNAFRSYKPVEGEMVRVIKLNVRLNNTILRDQFEWDINNPKNNPEDFAESLVADLGLSSEFMLPIAHQIREQILEYQKVSYQYFVKLVQTAHQEKRNQYYYKGGDYTYGYGRGYGMQETSRIGTGGQDLGEGVKTMVRSLDLLFQPQQQNVSKFFQPSPIEEPFNGWAPDVQILSESDLKKIEKQEERKARINKHIKLRDEELPFTNVFKRIKSPVRAPSIQKGTEILQQTYYNIAHPPNIKPLEKLKTCPSLATTFQIPNKNMKNTKYCMYTEDYNKQQHRIATMESDLDEKISNAIGKASCCDDYYKNFGQFYFSKTSQNYTNTIESLANYDKSNVFGLEDWYSKKINSKAVTGSDYKNAIQHDKTIQDPELLLKSPLVQSSELLSATTAQLKSVLKQKTEMQRGKANAFNMSNTKSLSDLKLKSQNSDFLPQIKKSQKEISEERRQMEQINEGILMPMGKKEAWEAKEKAANKEIKLQYTVGKLEEQLKEMKEKLDSMRQENTDLEEKIKGKYKQKLKDIQAEVEMHTNVYNETIQDNRSRMSSTLTKKKGKVEDFMKVKAVRDHLGQKKDKVNQKIAMTKEKIQVNLQRSHMMETEVAQIKRDIELTKQEQIVHYQNLLRQGIDARQDGLIWIIRALWLLGQDVQVEYMPRFLDSESIKFLLAFAKLDIKRTELHDMLMEIRLFARKDRMTSVFKNKALNNTTMNMTLGLTQQMTLMPSPQKMSVFNAPQSNPLLKQSVKQDLFAQKSKEEVMQQTKQKLHEITQTLTAVNLNQENAQELDFLMELQDDMNESKEVEIMEPEEVNGLTLDSLQQKPSRFSPIKRNHNLIDLGITYDSIENLDQQTLEVDGKIVEKNFNELSNKMQKMKKEQLDRIAKEFLFQNYEKRFKVSQEVVLAALVGEEKAKAALNSELKKQDDYKRIVEKHKTFTFASLREITNPLSNLPMNRLRQT